MNKNNIHEDQQRAVLEKVDAINNRVLTTITNRIHLKAADYIWSRFEVCFMDSNKNLGFFLSMLDEGIIMMDSMKSIQNDQLDILTDELYKIDQSNLASSPEQLNATWEQRRRRIGINVSVSNMYINHMMQVLCHLALLSQVHGLWVFSYFVINVVPVAEQQCSK